LSWVSSLLERLISQASDQLTTKPETEMNLAQVLTIKLGQTVKNIIVTSPSKPGAETRQ
jgi:hypothetical protein